MPPDHHYTKLFRYQSESGPRLGVETFYGRYDLTGMAPDVFTTIGGWLSQPDPASLLKVAAAGVNEPMADDIPLLAPIDTSEVWAAGVTYDRSRSARQEESRDAGTGDVYDRVYNAERPEIFFKSAGWRVAGPGKPVRFRRDSAWNVPEPELTLVLSSAGKIVGFTIGNDMSSRSIEGENPLYLPQAKMYDGACALGPAILLIDDPAQLRDLTVRLDIARAGTTAYTREITTARMKRTPEDLSAYLFRELSFPDGAFLMTGTGIIPPAPFTLQIGDRISITIEGAGTLVNTVD
jgi:2-dehydro-3-deoxy-D-arabinonate dehydratase